MKRATKFIVFFIALLTVSTSRYLLCEHCGFVTPLTTSLKTAPKRSLCPVAG